MKKIILIIGILIGFAIGASAEVGEDTVKRESPKFVSIESPFQNKFTNELIKYVETGEVSDFLIESLNQNELGFSLINTIEYTRYGDEESFKVFLKTYLDIRTTNINVVKGEEYFYTTKVHGFGDSFKISIYYEGTQRRDDVIVNYNHKDKVLGFSIWKDVYNQPYLDGDLGVVVGLD
jgi:hypothetical protein